MRFSLQIAAILLIKTVIIFVLWLLFFSHPISKNERQKAVTQIILNQSK